ncbi:poly-beta-1,6-N-acetyl-D-glucosamine biosynthesis protein PgaD [Brenneria izadpanahii]|uniref:Poly-beta-1,6-N-acetyl-D-glucosamine biosynthesis protein PgaD n=1 Tax=Brenneria izadpanahii TaxID=2722756 RepID=A0ABX7UQE3_9GAMM|nr:poly-beta-1,6-N-acetyl-D-glucosamine biosynthesis protein PgaD [Brenneria izadpanahii]QTF07809.1 poly-beta-1,6-N-acetyl-D-glucosamine biosynthesis protein PgaD [Brenneria izadpanahii]
MNSPLILTERRLLPLLFDILMTLCGWCGFILLMTESLLLTLQQSPWAGPRPISSELNTFSLYLAIGIFNALLLIGWAKYNQFRFRIERRKRSDDLNSGEVARSFSIHKNQIDTLNHNRVQHVWHDEDGRLVRIEAINVTCGA